MKTVRSPKVARLRNVTGVWKGRGLHVTRTRREVCSVLQIMLDVPSTQVAVTENLAISTVLMPG
jgi:hypothetical protein